MTQDEIIRMARGAGAIRRYWGDNKDGFAFESDEQLERFAALVAEATKERCAKVCEAEARASVDDYEAGGMFECAAAIRGMK